MESLCLLATRSRTAAHPTSKIAIAVTELNDAILPVVTNAMLQNIHAVPKRAQTNAPLARPLSRASVEEKGAAVARRCTRVRSDEASIEIFRNSQAAGNTDRWR